MKTIVVLFPHTHKSVGISLQAAGTSYPKLRPYQKLFFQVMVNNAQRKYEQMAKEHKFRQCLGRVHRCK